MQLTPNAAAEYQKFLDACHERLQPWFTHGALLGEVSFDPETQTLTVDYRTNHDMDFQTFKYADFFTPEELRIGKIDNLCKE